MYFYEIHEGDEDIGSAVLVCHPERFEPLEFFALVKKARLLLIESYEEATLAEAIANELQRTSGFLHVTDERLIASVAVGDTEQDTFLVTEGEEDRSVYVSTVDDEEEDET